MKARLLKDIRDPTGETDEVIPAGTIVEVVELTVEGNVTCFPLKAHEAEVLLPTFDDLGFEVWGTGGGSAEFSDFCRHPGDQERSGSRSLQNLRIRRRVAPGVPFLNHPFNV